MKRMSVILMLLMVSLASSGKTKLLRYGIEWGYTATFLEGHNFIYQSESEPHYLVPPEQAIGITYASNAFILLNCGFNLDEKSSLGIAAGYSGVYKERCSFPVLLRYNFHPATIHKDGHFLIADAGVGIPGAGGKVMVQGSVGAGYRYALSDKLNLDITLSLRGVYDNPPIWDSYDKTYISPQYIRKNDAGYASLNIGVAINF